MFFVIQDSRVGAAKRVVLHKPQRVILQFSSREFSFTAQCWSRGLTHRTIGVEQVLFIDWGGKLTVSLQYLMDYIL